MGFSVRMTVITTMPLIREELQMSHAEAGLLLSVLSFFYGIIQFPSGILTDIYDNKKLLIVVLLSLSISGLGISLSSNIYLLAVSLILSGLLIGFSTPICFTILSKTFTEKIGTVFGIYETAPSLAQSLGTVVAGIIATRYSWHLVYYVWIILDLGFVVLIAGFFKKMGITGEKRVIDRKTIEGFFSNKTLMYFLVVFVMNSVCSFSVLSMAPSFMYEVHGLDVASTAAIFGGTRLLGLVGSFMGGYLSDRFSKPKLLLFSLGASSMSTYAFAILPFGPWIVGILCLNALSISIFYPVTYTLLSELTTPSMRGKAQGLYNTMAFTISSMFPFVMGVVTDLSSFRFAFLLPPSIGALGAVWILFLIKKGTS